jgi:Icc-related predicted phosphoesterase
MIRIAAVGDVHAGLDAPGFEGLRVDELERSADVLLIAGDLTQHGYHAEAARLAQELDGISVPIVAVLGNHDYHQGEEGAIRREMQMVGVRVLEGENVVLELPRGRLGIAGVKGFGGGFLGACASEFGEAEMKAFVAHSRRCSERLKACLKELDCDMRVALTHYSPSADTLMGERTEIFPFLGTYMLGEAIDTTHCTAAFHGHAHAGTEHGATPAGVPVFNVARPVIRVTYKVYAFNLSPPKGQRASPGLRLSGASNAPGAG